MRFATRLASVCTLLLAAIQAAPAQDARGQSANPLGAIRTDRWADAQALAAGLGDPVAEKLTVYYRLLAPGAAAAPEIAEFARANPDWPNQVLLERRRQDAIATEPDEAIVLAQCAFAHPTLPATMLRCAEALANGGRDAEAAATARDAWINAIVDATMEANFLRRWSGIPSAEDHWARLRRLAWNDPVAAGRQIARLDPARRAAGDARMALRRDEPAALGLVAALPADDRADPGLTLDWLRHLRRTDRITEAAELWRTVGATAQQAAPDHAAAFWTERNIVARRLLKDGDKASAYAIAAAHGQTAAETATEAEFLAGFVALRQLNDPALARRHFLTLAAVSKAAITQGRAHYWLGRAAVAAGRDPIPEWRLAAAWPLTFYGQLASLALDEDGAKLAARIDALRDPEWDGAAAAGFASRELARATEFLAAWGDAKRARPFLLRLEEVASTPRERAQAAALALKVGLPDMAVFIARRIGRDGGMLPRSGWPMPFEPPGPLDPAVALAVMRQESSFDIGAISSSGARGLMQLMPFTAQAVAKRLGVATSLAALTSDPAHNMRLGTSYMTEVLDRFAGSVPLAAAGYNAGPHRVTQWLAEYGDPRSAQIDMLDWLELIPFNETRNYVQRVMENMTIYRARRGDPTPNPMARWAR